MKTAAYTNNTVYKYRINLAVNQAHTAIILSSKILSTTCVTETAVKRTNLTTQLTTQGTVILKLHLVLL